MNKILFEVKCNEGRSLLKSRNFMSISGILLLIFILIGCKENTKPETVNTNEVIHQIKIQIDAFHKADTSLNAQAVMDLLWPEYEMLVDGKFTAYKDLEEGIGEFMSSLKYFHTEWTDLKIIPIGPNHAISAYIFHDSIMTKQDKLIKAYGPNTFVWEKRDGVWKVIYGDADHYHDEE